jgi:hypothetical protein
MVGFEKPPASSYNTIGSPKSATATQCLVKDKICMAAHHSYWAGKYKLT